MNHATTSITSGVLHSPLGYTSLLYRTPRLNSCNSTSQFLPFCIGVSGACWTRFIFLKASQVCSCKRRRSGAMANLVDMGVFLGFLAALLLSFPDSSLCARAMGMTETAVTESSYSTIASPMAEYCSTDFSQVSYEDVKAACPANANEGANAACCAAFNNKACQYEAQVNNFGSMCPMLFINYLGAAGPYPAGYFVGPCVDGSKGFCIRH